ncbi:MAG: hypothetical protein ABEJ31_08275 [Haloarculaceae archaeon]
MNWELAAGVGLLALGLAGYSVGVWYAFPGRAFSVTAVMLGLLLLATGLSGAEAIEA